MNPETRGSRGIDSPAPRTAMVTRPTAQTEGNPNGQAGQGDAEILEAVTPVSGRWWVVTKLGERYVRQAVAAWGTFRRGDEWTVSALVAGDSTDLITDDGSGFVYSEAELATCDCSVSEYRPVGVPDPCWCRRCGAVLDCSECEPACEAA